MDLRAIVDGALEVPVLPSFSRVGPAVRSRLDDWRPVDSYDLRGRVVLITGATSGIGLAATTELARCGATMIVLGRDREKTEGLRDSLIGQTGDTRHAAVVADMGDLQAVRSAAEELSARGLVPQVLIHNAGALISQHRLSPEGTEATIASQVVGPFLLTGLLLEQLRRAAPARVITMSSGGMYAERLDVAHLEMPPHDYRGSQQYARAKRAQVTLNELWATRMAGTGVVFHAMHPGWVDTPGIAASLPRFRRAMRPLLRSPEQGADTLVWLAADDGEPLATTGRFWLDRRPRSIHKLPTTRRSDTAAERARLWAWCVERSGCDPSS
jgi:dehydrogenase/reductase SDR family member 12